MIISERDIELLKIICWCKNIPAPSGKAFESIYDMKLIKALEYFNLISISKDGKNIRPRVNAYDLLEVCGYKFPADNKPQSRERVLLRRNISAQIIMTFYMAGISVFNDSITGPVDEPVYIASFAARQDRSINVLSNTRFNGVFVMKKEAYIVFYVDDYGVFYQHERSLFNNFIQAANITDTAIIFMGSSIDSIAENIFGIKQNFMGKRMFNTDSFAKVYENTALPVYFIPVGETGAQILKLLLIQDYREVLAKALLKNKYQPPYEGMTGTDAVNITPPHNPAAIALDMNVKRLDLAVETAKKAGYSQVAFFALIEQVNFLLSRYGITDNEHILAINMDGLKNDMKKLNYDIALHEPPSKPYITDKGRYLDVADFAYGRKAGKQSEP